MTSPAESMPMTLFRAAGRYQGGLSPRPAGSVTPVLNEVKGQRADDGWFAFAGVHEIQPAARPGGHHIHAHPETEAMRVRPIRLKLGEEGRIEFESLGTHVAHELDTRLREVDWFPRTHVRREVDLDGIPRLPLKAVVESRELFRVRPEHTDLLSTVGLLEVDQSSHRRVKGLVAIKDRRITVECVVSEFDGTGAGAGVKGGGDRSDRPCVPEVPREMGGACDPRSRPNLAYRRSVVRQLLVLVGKDGHGSGDHAQYRVELLRHVLAFIDGEGGSELGGWRGLHDQPEGLVPVESIPAVPRGQAVVGVLEPVTEPGVVVAHDALDAEGLHSRRGVPDEQAAVHEQ